MSQYPSIPLTLGKTAELPTQGTIIGIEAIQITVVGDKVDLVLSSDRREADRALGDEPPKFVACLRVQRRHAVGNH